MTPCLALPNDRTEEQARAAIDLSRPSYSAAYALSRPLAQAGDRAAAAALFTRLLMHIAVEDGGLLGLDEESLELKCATDPRLDHKAALAAIWDAGPWPRAQVAA